MTGLLRREPAGLTLLELLAAAVILSAVAAVFASVARDASGALREAARSRGAGVHAALELWELSRPGFAAELAALAKAADEGGTTVEREWEFRVDGFESGGPASWRLRAMAAPSSGAGSSDPRGDSPPASWGQPAAAVTLRVWRDGDDPSSSVPVPRIVPLPAPPGSAGGSP